MNILTGILLGLAAVLWIWFLFYANEIEAFLNDEFGWKSFPSWMK